jgi:ABC-type transporter Mla subunit MlaD
MQWNLAGCCTGATIRHLAISNSSFAELDDQIKKARANLDQFVDNVSNTMKEIIGSQNQNLQQLIATRDRIEQRRTQVRFLFDDLVRLSMQEYLQTGNEEVLNKNLDTIRDMFDEAKVPSFLSLQSIRHLCDGPVEIAYEDAKGKVDV